MRRTRYRFRVIHGDQEFERHILAYDRFSAEAYFRARYDTVEYLGTGTRSVSPASAAKWRLDPAALREAIDFLGLTLPVKIKQTGHQGGRRGAYWLRQVARQRYHHITVKNWLTPEQACRTLWHELAHAMQAERYNDPSAPFVVVQQAWANAPERRGAYRNRPVEVEARSYEDYGVEVQIAVPA